MRALLFAFGLLASSHLSAAQEAFTIDQLHFKSIFATKVDEPDSVYSLLGSGEFRATRTKDSDSVVSSWLKSHPQAHVVKVSKMSPIMKNGTGTDIYIWVIDRRENLNTYLIREGIFPAGVMYDKIDWFSRLTKDQRINVPVEKTHLRRLVNDEVYREFVQKVHEAEKLARTEKKGIWSDEYKQERKDAGIE